MQHFVISIVQLYGSGCARLETATLLGTVHPSFAQSSSCAARGLTAKGQPGSVTGTLTFCAGLCCSRVLASCAGGACGLVDLAQHCLALPALASCLAAVGALADEAEVAAEQHNLVAGGCGRRWCQGRNNADAGASRLFATEAEAFGDIVAAAIRGAGGCTCGGWVCARVWKGAALKGSDRF